MKVRARLFLVLSMVACLVLSGLFVRLRGSQPDEESLRQATAINLALRRTAHLLLRAASDSTSRVPAVEQAGPSTFRLRLNRMFSYDKLPGLLRESLQLHRVASPYDVAVLDCQTRTLQLGYSIQDLTDTAAVPCVGRTMPTGCYVLQVTFATQATSASGLYWPVLAMVGLLAGFFVLTWRRHPKPSTEEAVAALAPAERLYFGQSWLDVSGQLLMTGKTQHNLTYRETKLLRLLARHPNEILERNRILKLVWEDEGITVGRSVDVFVSRLRKLLTNDPTLRIAAIHGVGYRLEVVPLHPLVS